MKKVILVAGHKRSSKGAYNKEMDIWEYDLNIKEVMMTYELLELRGFEPIIIYRDTYAKLPKDINVHYGDIILLFHHNSYNTKVGGTETLYYHKSEKGKKLASILHKKIVKKLNFEDRGIKGKGVEDRGGYALKYTNAPCVLLEPCFMDNTLELGLFLERQNGYVNCIVDGIEEYFK